MTLDPKLVEAVARTIADKQTYGVPWEQQLASSQLQYMGQAQAVLAAISVSGEWWVAPAERSVAMQEAWLAETDEGANTADIWKAIRDAHLKDTGTDS